MRTPKAARTDLLAQLVVEAEHDIVERYVRKHNGSVTAAARALGIRRQAMDRKIARHELRDLAAQLRTRNLIPGAR